MLTNHTVYDKISYGIEPKKYEEDTMRKLIIATYNIRHGADAELDFSVLANDLLSVEADIVGIQEMDIGTKRVAGADSLALICEGTPYKYSYFAKAMDYNGGEYGTAILSRFPIIEAHTQALESSCYEPRAFGYAKIDVDGEILNFINTHIEHMSDEQRRIQFAQLGEFIKGLDSFILTGDFNTDNFSEFDAIEGKKLVNNSETYFPTFPAHRRAIDNIVISDKLSYADATMVETGHSDHHMLYAVVGGDKIC